MSLIRNFTIGFMLYAVSGAGLFSQDSGFSRLAAQINTNANGVFLCTKSKAESGKINSALNDRKLVGYNPFVFEFDDTPGNLEMAGRELL